jgi:hypothetical protein
MSKLTELGYTKMGQQLEIKDLLITLYSMLWSIIEWWKKLFLNTIS